MLTRFLKPRWKHRNPEVRQAAIQRLSDQAILQEVANNDPDVNTRKLAVSLISDLQILIAIHTDPDIQDTLNSRFITLLPDAIRTRTQRDSIENYVTVRGGASLATDIARQSKSPETRLWVIPLLQDSETLEILAASDSSAEVRLRAAERLESEADIQRALKRLGRKDKRVSHLLKQKLEQIRQHQQRQQEIEKLIADIALLGNHDHWQRDNTQLLSLQTRWPSLSDHCNTVQQQHFDDACKAAASRIDEKRQQEKSRKPVVAEKESQCKLIENFVLHLEKRHRISNTEADDLQSTLDTLLADWNELAILPESLEVPLANRFHAQLTLARKHVETLKHNARSTHDLEKIIDRGERLLQRKSIKSAEVTQLRQHWEKQPLPDDKVLAKEYREHFSRLLKQLNQRIERQAAQRDKGLEEIARHLQQIQDNLDADKLGDSIELERRIRQTLDTLADIPPARLQEIQQQLREFTPRIRELNGWRHWGTDRVREQLIEEAEQLVDTSQSPQERARAVANLRSRWKNLVTIDHSANRPLWKRFDKACNAAYDLCRQHHKEESQRRKINLQARETICTELEQLHQQTDWEAPDWREVDRSFQRIRNQWSKAGPVDRGDWQTIQARYRKATAAIDDHLNIERKRNQAYRLGLIEQLESLIDSDDLPAALATVRQAQKAWRPTISDKRAIEQKLWKRFKAAGDALYAREKSRISQETSKVNTLLEQKIAICDAIEQLADSPANIGSQLADLKAAWNDIVLPRNKSAAELEQRYRHVLQSLDFALERRQLEKQSQSIEELHTAWMAGDRSPPATPAADAAQWLLDMEIMLELPSPDELEQARMERKVAKLSAQLNERNAQNTLQGSITLLQDFCQHTSATELPERDRQRLNTIKDAILAELTREMEELRQS